MKHRILTALTLTALTLSASPGYATTDSSEADPALTQRVDADEVIAPAGKQVELDAGHIDLGPKMIDGKWHFMARDDSQATPVWRQIDDMLYRVSDNGILTVPNDATYSFIKSDDQKVWVVPQQEIPGVVWLGWNTQDPAVTENVNGTVTLTYGGHDGPGQFTAFVQAGNFGAPQLLWTSDKKEQQPIDVELHSHTHANWVFTKPGIHRVTLTAAATLNDGTTVSETKTLTFAVGSDTDAATALDETAKLTSDTTEPSNAPHAEKPRPAQHGPSTLPIVAGLAGIGIVSALLAIYFFKRRESATKKSAKDEL
ncbi:choice-of-anchor M domain-containing protein [Arcanobacterium haemolyticum]